MEISRFFINNIGIYPFSSKKEIIGFVEQQNGILTAINAEKILHATEQTRAIINHNIGYCDGLGAVMALHKKGFKNIHKIPGCELWLDIVRRFYLQKTFYLVGGKDIVIDATVDKLEKEFPEIHIVGFRNGYIRSEQEKKELLADIVLKKPDVVFVAMGSPKQEILMDQLYKEHPAIYQGLGGSFDVYTGFTKRAPKWWLDHNLEFAYRLFKQPTRIKRQIHLVKFLFLLEMGKF